MKKFRIIGLRLVLCLALSLSIVLINGNVATAFASDNKSDLNIERVVKDIFGDQKIRSTEYLHNYDDSTDYIYVDFEDYGYAIFFKNTMEMLEYSPNGSLPFENSKAKRYYGGPTNYLQKEGELFRNVSTGDIVAISNLEAKSFSNEMRSFLSNSSQELRMEGTHFSNSRQAEINEKSVDTENESIKNSSQIKSNAPNINTNSHIIPTGGNGKLIANSQYFTTNPTHGDNFTGGSYGNGNSGTCGAVAAQILLTYNNYYNDRRIIENRFLNGFNDATNMVTLPERNPNLCADPTSMTRWTLGSRSEDTGANSYYSNVVTTIMPANTSGASVNQVRNGMRTLLGQQLANNQFTVDSDEKGWFFGWSPISSTPIKNQINAERPLIIGMSSNLGGADHFVVGYGYEDYTYPATGNTYSGYVVHFGWQGDTNVWVNSSWCDSYITMEMHHAHTHTATGTILDGQRMVMQCTVCGHRTTESLFNISGGTITGVRHTLTGSISIPSVINGTSITAIGANAFANQPQLSQITIPASVRDINSGSFQGCINLQTVMFLGTSQLQTIGASAFANCTVLSTITLPSTVITIGDSAFKGCIGITSLPIPNNVITIGYSAFYGCTGITSISIPDSVKSIGSNAFFGTGFWNALPNNSIVYTGKWVLGYKGTLSGTISLNPNTVYIADSAFSNSGLTSITIPNSVESIGNSAFYNCSLTSVTFSSNSQLQRIGDYAFSSCMGLRAVSIPYGVTSIGNSAFYYCTNLEIVTIPDSVTSIKNSAFECCYSMTSIIIPDSVESMGWEVFYNTNITIYAEASSKPDGWYYDWNYNYPNNHPVVWGCELSQNRAYVVSFSNGIENYYNGISNPYRESYTFGGWAANAGGAIPVYVAPSGAYHAIWMNTALLGSKYTVNFNSQGVGNTPNNITVTYGQAYGALPMPTNPGYSFGGWWTASNGGTQVTSNMLVLITQPQTLYAKWTQISMLTKPVSDTFLELEGIYEYDGIYFDDVTPIIGTLYYADFLASLNMGLTRNNIIDSELELEVSKGQEYSFYLYNGDSWDLIGILSDGIRFSLGQFDSDVIIFKLLCIDSATQWGYLSGNAALTIYL